MADDTTLARLRAIWVELLDGTDVGDGDHFVELGGDSIAAALCVMRIAAEFGVEIPVVTLFLDETTLRTLARVVDAAASGVTD